MNHIAASDAVSQDSDHRTIDEDAIVQQLVRLIELCEQNDLDLDLMINSAWHIHSGEPEFGS
jgi:hypothetical protein